MQLDSHDTAVSSTVGQAPGRRVPAWVWALVAFLLGACLSLWLARAEWRRGERDAQHVFERETENVAAAIRGQLDQCAHLIRTFQSIFLASESVSQDEYDLAYQNMQSGSVARISLLALAYAERRRMQDGDHFITTMFAPQAGNEAIRGLDLSSQPVNLQALLRSRDTGQVAMSAPFRLRQSGDGLDQGDGFILRLPVYAPGKTPATLEERRASIIGSIGASFRISELIAQGVPDAPALLADLVVEDVSGGQPRLLYERQFDAPGDQPPHKVEIRFSDRTWRVVAHAKKGAVGEAGGTLVLWIGMLISALLAALTWSLVSTRERAIALGTSMSQRFSASEERFRKLNELLPCLVLLVRKDDGAIVYRNAAARIKLSAGGDSAELAALFDPESIARLCNAGDGSQGAVDVQMRDADGAQFWASAWISTIELDGVQMYLLVASDISEQRLLTERLSYQASHDSLTRLFNRREFEARAQVLLARPGHRDGALLFIDLDQFKLINDTSGHRAGDELLVQLAVVMRERLRPEEVLGRLGGDEFGVLLPGISATDVAQAAERLRRCIEGFIFTWEQRSYTISASIGVVMLANAMSLKELFAHADAACYLAKEAGRNRVHVYAENDVAITSRLGEMEWANRIRDALRDGRLLLDYQELHPLQPGGEAGAHIELLLRLRGEDGGEVLLGAFLPAAERYGLMPLIDRWVVDTVLGNFNRLHPDGGRLSNCAINLSGASLEDADLFERIAHLLALYQVDPRRLVFEITETMAMRNFAASSGLIVRLRSLGCQVALDDFGAGMSSFGYLKNLELDMVKIDGSFVQNMASDRMSQSIIRAVTDIGHQQGLTVVAEWVSSTEMLDILASMGVDYAQGFALHRPERVVFQRDGHRG